MATQTGDDLPNTLTGTPGDDILKGLGGDDLLIGLGGDDLIDGGSGSDTASFFNLSSPAVGATVDLRVAGPQDTGIGTVTLISIENLTGGQGTDNLIGDNQANVIKDSNGGDDVLTGNGGNDTIAVVRTVISGVPTNVTLDGGAGDDRLSFSTLGGRVVDSATFRGGAGDDVITISNLQTGKIDGGADFDRLQFVTDGVLQMSRAYAVSFNGFFISVNGALTSNAVTNVERIQFADGYVDTSLTDTAAEVYRLYNTALGRWDTAGLANWTQAIDKFGVTLQAAADAFVGSAEFTSRFGANLSDTQFVSRLYANTFLRDPDAAQLQSGLDYLGAGHSRAELVLSLSESAEHIENSRFAIQQGLWVGDPTAAKVARLYDAAFDRLPDAVGEANWTAAVNGGVSLQAAADAFVGSNEFQARYGTLDDTHFIQQLYQNVLGRAPDQNGLDTWSAFLAGGHSRSELLVGFSESGEHIALTAPYTDDGVMFT
jgi:hypothetical protein